MKKIAIVTRQMIAGGIEKALISMLEVIPSEKYEVTLFVMGSGGEFEKFIPKWVNIKNLYGDEKTIIEKIINKMRKGKFIDAFRIGFYSLKSLGARPGYQQEKILAKILPKENEIFDLAIAYHVPASFPVVYVVEHLKAEKKVAWIHSDVEVYKRYLSNYIDYYSKFDKIYCVSEDGKAKFDNQYPNLSKKTEVFHNIINDKQLDKLSKEDQGFKDSFNGIRILTVARLTKQKGCDILPRIVSKLAAKNNIRWYIIGDGEEREHISKEIEKYKVQDKLILLGLKTNPYPYFKECDIYVQPSRHEGYCITLAEARHFNKPIVTTNFVGAVEQIKNNETGLIVRFDEREIEESIIKIVEDDELRDKLILNLNKSKDINNLEIEKIYTLME